MHMASPTAVLLRRLHEESRTGHDAHARRDDLRFRQHHESGGGTLLLAGADTQTGDTIVAAGTLKAAAATVLSAASTMTVQHGATLAVIAIAGRLPDKRPSAPIGSRRAAPRTRARRPPIVSASHLATGAADARGRVASGSLRPAPSTIGYLIAAAADEVARGHMDSGSGPEIRGYQLTHGFHRPAVQDDRHWPRHSVDAIYLPKRPRCLAVTSGYFPVRPHMTAGSLNPVTHTTTF
jgi:autotransporter-associated beta strand protein